MSDLEWIDGRKTPAPAGPVELLQPVEGGFVVRRAKSTPDTLIGYWLTDCDHPLQNGLAPPDWPWRPVRLSDK